MQLGLFTPVFHDLSLDSMLRRLARWPEIRRLELGTGGFSGSAHLSLDTLLRSPQAVADLRHQLDDAGLSLSALACHGNPVHPQPRVAAEADTLFRRTVDLAHTLGVPTVVTFSGCPGGAPGDTTPNWITAAWPPEYAEALEWQWTEKLIPYWQSAARLATQAGVRIGLEAHPGFCVHNTDTLLRLRASTSPALGITLDPSHLWWQGMDIPTVIAALGSSIHHVHAKDTALSPPNIARNGVLDTKTYRDLPHRSWIFRSVGWGHSELEWKGIVSALRLAGYDGTLSIEHEDALASTDEGISSAVSLLARVLLHDPPAEAHWA